MKTLKELRKEYTNLRYKQEFKQELMSYKHCLVEINRVSKNGTLLHGFELHHIIALKDGGTNDPSNLIWIPTAIHRMTYNGEYKYNTREKVLEFCSQYITNEKEMSKEEFEFYIKENTFSVKKYNEKYRKENKEYFKNYRKENKEYIKEWQKEYKEKNKENIKESNKRYWKNNKDKLKRYREQNEEYYKNYGKEYWKMNKDKLKNKNRKYEKEYSKTRNGIISRKKRHCRQTIKNTKNMDTKLRRIVELNKLNQGWI